MGLALRIGRRWMASGERSAGRTIRFESGDEHFDQAKDGNFNKVAQNQPESFIRRWAIVSPGEIYRQDQHRNMKQRHADLPPCGFGP